MFAAYVARRGPAPGVATAAALFAFAAGLGPATVSMRGEAPAVGASVGTPAFQAGYTEARRAPAPAGATTLHDHGEPSAQEQLMLELVNRSRADPAAEAARFGIDLNADLPPGTIAPDPKPPLGFHPLLITSARGHSDWMLSMDVFSHDGASLDGATASNPGDRMEAAGFPFTGSWTWGENLAWKGTTGTPNLTDFTVAEHENLFRSAGHRENLMNPDFDELGIGVRQGVFTVTNGQGMAVDYNAVMTTQNFARSGGTPGPLVLGVVYRDTNGDKFYNVGEGLAGVTVMPASGTSYAVTSASGGYAFPTDQTSGTLSVTISGPGITAPITKSIALGATNVKLDFDVLGDMPLTFTPGQAGFNAQQRFQFELTGRAGVKAQVFYSADLNTWLSLGTYTLASGKLTVIDTTARQTMRFYRATVVP